MLAFQSRATIKKSTAAAANVFSCVRDQTIENVYFLFVAKKADAISPFVPLVAPILVPDLFVPPMATQQASFSHVATAGPSLWGAQFSPAATFLFFEESWSALLPRPTNLSATRACPKLHPVHLRRGLAISTARCNASP